MPVSSSVQSLTSVSSLIGCQPGWISPLHAAVSISIMESSTDTLVQYPHVLWMWQLQSVPKAVVSWSFAHCQNTRGWVNWLFPTCVQSGDQATLAHSCTENWNADLWCFQYINVTSPLEENKCFAQTRRLSPASTRAADSVTGIGIYGPTVLSSMTKSAVDNPTRSSTHLFPRSAVGAYWFWSFQELMFWNYSHVTVFSCVWRTKTTVWNVSLK